MALYLHCGPPEKICLSSSPAVEECKGEGEWDSPTGAHKTLISCRHSFHTIITSDCMQHPAPCPRTPTCCSSRWLNSLDCRGPSIQNEPPPS